jgi:hypothetical protein
LIGKVQTHRRGGGRELKSTVKSMLVASSDIRRIVYRELVLVV